MSQTEAAKTMMNLLPHGAILLVHRPGMFTFSGRRPSVFSTNDGNDNGKEDKHSDDNADSDQQVLICCPSTHTADNEYTTSSSQHTDCFTGDTQGPYIGGLGGGF